ncbi:Copia protein [Symbiodinium microadriaticum]|uniref:Copia protein n=1 Tax=Symbiodinium microadriaticum TaxID=2951 RepID=A0A1Q9CUB8_SYMMI|nr:Copia protein [Symbiodinium microadriaticum]
MVAEHPLEDLLFNLTRLPGHQVSPHNSLSALPLQLHFAVPAPRLRQLPFTGPAANPRRSFPRKSPWDRGGAGFRGKWEFWLASWLVQRSVQLGLETGQSRANLETEQGGAGLETEQGRANLGTQQGKANLVTEQGEAGGADGSQQQGPAMVSADQIDRLVKQRLEQAFNGVFGRLLSTSERAAQAAETQASAHKSDSLVKGLKIDPFRPSSREEELKQWKEWWFSFMNYVSGHDAAYERDISEIRLEEEVTHDLMTTEQIERSRRLYSLLCSLLKGRPLLIIKGLESSKCGLEAIRRLRCEMEPKEKARSLALLRQLAAWTFQPNVNLHEQLVKYEEALRMYEEASGKEYPQDLVLATVVTGLRDPLRSQVQLRMSSSTTYQEIREWIIQFENLNAPWASSLSGRGQANSKDTGGPTPMEVDVVKGKKGKDPKGKGKYGKPGKGKGEKGKNNKDNDKGKNVWGKTGKGWGSGHDSSWGGRGSWTQPWQSSSWHNGGWQSGWQDNGGKEKGKSKSKGAGGGCSIYWKNECPKGKGKVRQVEQSNAGATPSSASTAASSTTSSSLPSSASALRGINRIEAFTCSTPPGCRFTEVFDLTTLEDDEEFSLDGADVMMVQTAGATTAETFEMDATDGDGNWTLDPALYTSSSEAVGVLAVGCKPPPLKVDVVIDSGADVSVVVIQDAQGKTIPELGTRILNVELGTEAGEKVTVREKFSIAPIATVIMSLGRLLRSGWELGQSGGAPVIRRDHHVVPITLRRNTLTVWGEISRIEVAEQEEKEATPSDKTSNEPNHVNAVTFDDTGPLPPELQTIATRPGWHILPSGLPALVTHKCEELELERSLWSSEDWSWIAIFVRAEEHTRLPQPGDLWIQLLTLETETYEYSERRLAELDPDLAGARDVLMVLHVDELPRDLLSNPRDYFGDRATEEVVVPMEEEDGGGIGALPEEAVGEGYYHGPALEDDGTETLEGVRLAEDTELKVLKELCEKVGLSKSGNKQKVLRRLRDQRDVLARQMTAEIARKLFLEGEREPQPVKVPMLPSARQQELHNITHHPFAPWCEACLVGRSRQSPHPKADADKPVEEVRKFPKIEIDYGYTFTRKRHEIGADEEKGENRPDGQDGEGPTAEHTDTNFGDVFFEDPGKEAVDYRDQFALTLVAAESSTGWILAIPVLEKGSSSLKRVVEQLVRLSMQVSPGEQVLIQGDPEPSIKQVMNAFEACRSRLGLPTSKQWVPKESHASNGAAEKAISTIRTNGLTLRAFVEKRIAAKVEGHHHFFSWIMRHAGFLYNRFSVTPKGTTSYEAVFGRPFKGHLVPLGELVIFHKASKHRGDLQWHRGVYLGVHERNGAHILGTPDGVYESRSIRRLPGEEQWNAEMVLGMKGLPWSYMGTGRRKRPLYTAASGRVPILPDTATLEQLARAAGQAAAETIAAATPGMHPEGGEGGRSNNDEAASDPSSPSSSSTTSGQGQQQPTRPQQESQEPLQSHGSSDGNQSQREGEQQPTRPHQESRELLQPHGSSSTMDVSESTGGVPREVPDQPGPANPKRPRLLLDRPALATPSPLGSPAAGPLYPPGFAGVNEIYSKISMDTSVEELAGFDAWSEGLDDVLESENLQAEDHLETWWDDTGERPPELSQQELDAVDKAADATEVKRLLDMGVARFPKKGEDLSEHQLLTTKLVHDWRRRPNWLRRARLVAREFRTTSAWTSDLFAPSSSLAITHALVSYALTNDLELTTLDIKDAYLNVDQPTKVVIRVQANILEDGAPGEMTLVLDKLLPGQHIGASAWYDLASSVLAEANLTNFGKEPTLFRHNDPENRSTMILHADDGLLAANKKEREEILKVFGKKFTVQVGDPMGAEGDKFSFLKRLYLRVPEGIVMYSNGRYLEALVEALGPNIKKRDSPADASFQEPDDSTELEPSKAATFREFVGRLLYLSHSRPDIQFAVCVLSSKMAKPTSTSFRWLLRVVGYLAGAPDLGFLIKPVVTGAKFGYEGACYDATGDLKNYVVESITDADWAGCRRTRRSRTAVQLFLGGSLIGSLVRSQKAISLSSGESEFLAIIAGACEAIYVADCLRFMLNGRANMEILCRSDSAAGRGICQRLGCGRIRHLHCGVLWVQQAVRTKVLQLSSISGVENPADLGTKPLGGSRVRELLFTMGAVSGDTSPYGSEDKEEADRKREASKALKSLKTLSANQVTQVQALVPLVLLLSQIGRGLGQDGEYDLNGDTAASLVTFVAIGVTFLMIGILPFGLLGLLKWSLKALFQRKKATVEAATQTSAAMRVPKEVQVDRGMRRSEQRFSESYVDKCTDLEALLSQRCRENREMERALYDLRAENRQLQQRWGVTREPCPLYTHLNP